MQMYVVNINIKSVFYDILKGCLRQYYAVYLTKSVIQ